MRCRESTAAGHRKSRTAFEEPQVLVVGFEQLSVPFEILAEEAEKRSSKSRLD